MISIASRARRQSKNAFKSPFQHLFSRSRNYCLFTQPDNFEYFSTAWELRSFNLELSIISAPENKLFIDKTLSSEMRRMVDSLPINALRCVVFYFMFFFVASSSWETRFRPDSMAQRSNVNWTQRLQRTLKCLRVHTETRFVLLLSVGYHNDIACGCVRCYTPLYTLDDRRCCVI